MNTQELFKRHNLKMTPTRLAILAVLSQQSAPVSAPEILNAITGADMVTVYRNLNDFTKLGIIKAIPLQKERMLYELADLEHHHHMICVKCGDVEDVEVCLPKSMSKRIIDASMKFALLIDHQLEFKGLCRECA